MKVVLAALKHISDNIKETGKLSIPRLKNDMENIFIEKGFRSLVHGTVEQILVISLDNLEHQIETNGFYRELRRGYPGAIITLLVRPDVYPLVELCPYVNAVLPFMPYYTAPLNWFDEAVSFCHKYLWQRKFSCCYVLRCGDDLHYESLLAYLSGAADRIGYAGAPGDFLLTKSVLNLQEPMGMLERSLYLLRAAGYKIGAVQNEIWFDDKDLAEAKRILHGFSCGRRMLSIATVDQRNLGDLYDKFLPEDTCLVVLDELPVDIKNDLLQHGFTFKDLHNLANLRVGCAVLTLVSGHVGGKSIWQQLARILGVEILNVGHKASRVPAFGGKFLPWGMPSQDKLAGEWMRLDFAYDFKVYDCFLFHQGLGETCMFAFLIEAYKKIHQQPILVISYSPSRTMLMKKCPYIDQVLEVSSELFLWIRQYQAEKYQMKDYLSLHFRSYSVPVKSMKEKVCAFLELPCSTRLCKYSMNFERITEKSLAPKIMSGSKFILLVPFAICLGNHVVPLKFWENLVRRLKEAGYQPVFNAASEYVKGVPSVFLSIMDMLSLVNSTGNVIGVRTGLLDVIAAFTTARIQSIYPGDDNSIWTENKALAVDIKSSGHAAKFMMQDDVLDVLAEKPERVKRYMYDEAEHQYLLDKIIDNLA